LRRLIWILIFATCCASHAQQAPDNFRWIDFHSPKDQDVITWVSRALTVEDWTAIREIAVQYDAALVITTKRPTPQSPATTDSFSAWNVNLTNHAVTPLVRGVNIRWLDWMRFSDGAPEELAVLFENCRECAATTYFTAFHYDVQQHSFVGRWIHGENGIPLWSNTSLPNVDWNQVYAGLAEPNGRELIVTWNHFDYGPVKPDDEVIYRYDVDPFSGQERTVLLKGKDADAVKQRLCSAADAIPGLAGGQNSAICQELFPTTHQRRPVTTPPANNRGQSTPPGARH